MAGGILAKVALLAVANTSSQAQDIETKYSRDAMQQALETRERYDVHGLRFGISTSTLRPGTEAILDGSCHVIKR